MINYGDRLLNKYQAITKLSKTSRHFKKFIIKKETIIDDVGDAINSCIKERFFSAELEAENQDTYDIVRLLLGSQHYKIESTATHSLIFIICDFEKIEGE